MILRLATRMFRATIRRPLPLFVLMWMATGVMGLERLPTPLLFWASFPLGWFFDTLCSGRLPWGISSRVQHVSRGILIRSYQAGYFLPFLAWFFLFDDVFGAASSELLAVVMVLATRVFADVILDDSPWSSSLVSTTDQSSRLAVGFSEISGEMLDRLSARPFSLFIMLWVLFNEVLHEPISVIGIAMIVWFFRKNRDYLRAREKDHDRVLRGLIEADEKITMYRRVARAYAYIGLIAMPLVAFIIKQEEISIEAEHWQAMALYLGTLGFAVAIEMNPRLGPLVMFGATIAYLYAQVIGMILDPSQMTSLVYLFEGIVFPILFLRFVLQEEEKIARPEVPPAEATAASAA
jgi:hypothetical protein